MIISAGHRKAASDAAGRRVVRALEVGIETGTPITALQRKTVPPYRVLQLGITLPRQQLYAQADARIDRMIERGLLAEVRGLLEAGYTWVCPAMSGLGYAQWRLHLNGRIPYEEAVAAIRRDTRAFIRRQYAWFNGHDSGIHWLDATRTTPDDVIRRVHNWLSHREE